MGFWLVCQGKERVYEGIYGSYGVLLVVGEEVGLQGEVLQA
jgi:hypothetical protein